MQVGEKNSFSKMNVTAKAGTGREVVIVKEISAVEEKPIPYWNKGKGVLRVGPHPAKLSPVKGSLRSFLILESNWITF